MTGRLPYGEFIRRYDNADMLFYLDPPYWGCETDYGQDVFGRADFEVLAAQLAGIEGKFLLSINDRPGVRDVFGAFAITEVTTRYQVGGGTGRERVNELLIANFDIAGG